jgi:hypothetical protein
MKEDFPNSPPPRKRKFATWIFGILIFYTIFGFLILPPIVRVAAVKQISKQLDREVSIEKVKINPFSLSATVRGLLIKEKDGQPFVSWDDVYVNFQLSSIFRQRLDVQGNQRVEALCPCENKRRWLIQSLRHHQQIFDQRSTAKSKTESNRWRFISRGCALTARVWILKAGWPRPILALEQLKIRQRAT